LTIGNRINDVFVLGTPKIIIIGNKFDGNIYEIEDTKTHEIDKVSIEEIISYFKNK